jgi:hypothetical protein
MDEVTLPDGSTRRLGNIVPPQGLMKAWPRFGDVPDVPLIPRSEWADRIKAIGDGPDWPFLPPVHDQDGVGQCNADATTAMGEYIRAMQGLPYVQLSAADLYHRINGGADNGSLLEDAIEEMMKNGVGTAATCGEVWKRGQKQAPAAERTRFRMLECWLCPSFEHHMSAALQGFALNSGVMWYDSYKPGADGWLPAGRGGAGGHAIFGYKPAMKGSQFGIWHLNSWGAGWGLNGRFVIPESAYKGPVGGWFACRVMTDEGGVVPQEQP